MSKDSNYKLNKEELERAKDYFEIWMMAGFGGDAEMTAIRRTAYKAIKYCLASLFSDGGGVI